MIMALIPPLIVMLYFSSFDAKPLQVPSTYLWEADHRGFARQQHLQRLRKNILLVLQLIAVALLDPACLRPGFSGTTAISSRSIFLIDNSASMQATMWAARVWKMPRRK